jgi:hypothetical protein
LPNESSADRQDDDLTDAHARGIDTGVQLQDVPGSSRAAEKPARQTVQGVAALDLVLTELGDAGSCRAGLDRCLARGAAARWLREVGDFGGSRQRQTLTDLQAFGSQSRVQLQQQRQIPRAASVSPLTTV